MNPRNRSILLPEKFRGPLCALCIAFLFAPLLVAAETPPSRSLRSGMNEAPFAFERNEGQAQPAVKYLAGVYSKAATAVIGDRHNSF